MKLHIQGKGPLALSQRDFLTQGGEGQIYSKGNVAYKIYLDPSKMIPSGKIQELSALTHLNVIKPEDLLLDEKNKPVGYSMLLVKDTYALCQLFPKVFRTRNNVTPDMTLKLVRKLQEIVSHVHQHNILIVDLNELNFLVSQDFKEVYAIDVDSYQTPHFPATALMDSVRDRHSKTFSTSTDWFSFAITSFQMFVGIHPFKGKHPTIKTLDERMQQNISVLNSTVGIPASCYTFDVIPDLYRQWYSAVFDQGKRLPPPNELLGAITLLTKVKTVTGSDQFQIQELESFAGQDIVSALYVGNTKAVLTTGGLVLNRDNFPTIKPSVKVAVTPKSNCVVTASIDQKQLKLYNATRRQDVAITCHADELMEYDSRLYVKSLTNVLEIQFTELSSGALLASTKIVGQIVENSSKLYDGVVIQNLLGANYASMFPTSDACYQVRLKELDAYKILDARFEHGVLMVLGSNLTTASYDKLIFRFNAEYSSYDLRKIEHTTEFDLNFVVLDTGICVHLLEDGQLEIFKREKDSGSLKLIQDPAISTDMKLMRDRARLLFAKEGKLYSMTMKNKS